MDNVYNPTPYIRKALQDAPKKVDPPTNGALRYNGFDTSKIRAMGLNECCYPPSPKVIKAMQDNLSSVNLYPDAQCPRLSDIISERTGVDNNCIVWGNGSEELLKGAIDLSLSPGQGLVLPVPTFWGYKSMVAAFEADVSEIENLPDGHVDTDGILNAIHKNTKIVFLITPNNPSGRLVDEVGLKKVIHGVPEDVLLCVDEAYYDFGIHAGGPDVLKILKTRKGPWITVFTFSKAYAMAGMRIGYALCSDENLAQIAAGRDQIFEGLKELGLDPFPSVTNFVSTPISGNGREMVKLMLEKGIQINAWADAGYENLIRITVGTEEDNSACLAALKEALA